LRALSLRSILAGIRGFRIERHDARLVSLRDLSLRRILAIESAAMNAGHDALAYKDAATFDIGGTGRALVRGARLIA
jgi:hypothetical protein